jgi:cyclin A
MDKLQWSLTAPMRPILVDWLIDVCEMCKLRTNVLFLAVHYLDRFLSRVAVHRSKLQLVGVACILVASKHEAIGPVGVEKLQKVTDNTYEKEEILKMEVVLLNDFSLTQPTACDFLEAVAHLMPAPSPLDRPTLCLAYFIAECALLDTAVQLRFLPSIVSCSALLLARITITNRERTWTKAWEQASGYSLQDLRECAAQLHVVHARFSTESASLKAVYEKHSQAQCLGASLWTPPKRLLLC